MIIGKEVRVSELPNCDVCESQGKRIPAEYDAKTRGGCWAMLCKAHFQTLGLSLGIGKGQRLIRWHDGLMQPLTGHGRFAPKTKAIPKPNIPCSGESGNRMGRVATKDDYHALAGDPVAGSNP